MQSLTGAALGDLSRIGDANRGSLVFGGGAPFPFYARRSGVFGYANGLYGIDDPKRVEALIYEHLIMPKKEKGASG